MAASGPAVPDFKLVNDGNGLAVNISPQTGITRYRVGIRVPSTNEFDTVYFTNDLNFRIFDVKKDAIYLVSVALVDNNGVESLFSAEQYAKVLDAPPLSAHNTATGAVTLQLLPAVPNPSDESTGISVLVEGHQSYRQARIEITNVLGQTLVSLPIELNQGLNEVIYRHGFHAGGMVMCSLVIDGVNIATQRIVFK
jgi:hypothetical protein